MSIPFEWTPREAERMAHMQYVPDGQKTKAELASGSQKAASSRSAYHTGSLTRIPQWANFAYGNQVPPSLCPPMAQSPQLEDGGSQMLSSTGDNLGVGIQLPLEVVPQEGEPLQGRFEPTQNKGNNTGLPDTLKAGIETLSGMSMDDVNVHYHSSKPAEVQALAYTQGTEIHVGSGQEKHLPHEAWHVVQQKQGQVQPRLQVKGVAINDDQGLEREADVMGHRALSLWSHSDARGIEAGAGLQTCMPSAHMPIQRKPVNKTYEEMIKNKQFKLTKEGYLSHLEKSTSQPMAYVVNAILSYQEIAKIPHVVRSILEGLKNFDGRVGFVFGVNAPETKARPLDNKLQEAQVMISPLNVPIALVRSTFKGKFPYGTMRNEVMHSQETADLLAAFATQNLHPYLSIQDFDTGSRLVPSGQHIFNYLEERMSWDENFPAIRPLMITGGYRPDEALAESTKARFTKGGQAVPEELQKDEQRKEFVAKFRALIQKDMQARDYFARIHPLLPYAPEPNLFIDALPILLGRKDIQFGKGAAEFTQLAKSLNAFLADELDQYFSPSYQEAAPSIAVPKGQVFTSTTATNESGGVFKKPETFANVEPGEPFAQEGEVPFAQLDREEIMAQFQVYAQTGRHPLRDLSFFTDFIGGSIVTDLSRLAHGYLTANKLPQSHTKLTPVVDRFFYDKGAKKGASLATYRDQYRRHPYTRREPLRLKKLGAQEGDLNPTDKSQLGSAETNMGSAETNRMSSAISFPLPQGRPFSGAFVGIPEEHKVLSAHAVATSAPDDRRFRLFSFLQQDLSRVGGTPLDGNCLYHAVNQAISGGSTLEEAQALRNKVVEWVLHEDHLAIVAELAYESNVDLATLIHTIATNANWGGNAGDLAPKLVASTLGITIAIQQAGVPPITITPLLGQSRGTRTIYLQNSHYSINPPQSQQHMKD